MRTVRKNMATRAVEKIDRPLDPAWVERLVQETVGRWATITDQWLVVQDVQVFFLY